MSSDAHRSICTTLPSEVIFMQFVFFPLTFKKQATVFICLALHLMDLGTKEEKVTTEF